MLERNATLGTQLRTLILADLDCSTFARTLQDVTTQAGPFWDEHAEKLQAELIEELARTPDAPARVFAHEMPARDDRKHQARPRPNARGHRTRSAVR